MAVLAEIQRLTSPKQKVPRIQGDHELLLRHCVTRYAAPPRNAMPSRLLPPSVVSELQDGASPSRRPGSKMFDRMTLTLDWKFTAVDRIFSSLAVVALLLLCANLVIGLTGGDVNAAATELRVEQEKMHALRSSLMTPRAEVEAQEEILTVAQQKMSALQPAKSRHIMLGLLAAVVTLIVNSICVTYFIGTGRWCSEVSMTYGLDAEFDNEAKRLKRTTFPWSLLGIGTVLTIAALGAASDPGTLRETTAKYVSAHYLVSLVGAIVIVWAFWKQYGGIGANGIVIERILEEVQRIRTEKGLDVESPVTAKTATDPSGASA